MVEGRILITGISGMIGGLLTNTIYHSEAYKSGNVEIIGVGRNTEKAKNNLGSELFKAISFIEADILDTEWMDEIEQLDYIIHCASETASKEMIKHPIEVADGIVAGTRNLLSLAGRCAVKSMVYLSSMEVYGEVEDIGRPRLEEELGKIDLMSARSCYPMGKRMAEHYCSLFWKEYQVPVKVARLAQIFGKGVCKDDRRVYMQFAKAAVDGTNIVLKTEGKTLGNYCATDDAVRAIITILVDGENGDIYNVVNEANTMTIREMAELVVNEIASKKIQIIVQAEDNSSTGYATETKLRMSSEKLRRLGWVPTKDIKDMYVDAIKTL